jgi:uncharacterized membrane protein YozB (DUF420 family)
MAASILPTVNAILNGTSAVLMTVGFLMIRQRKITAHRICMISALVTSTLFLISYLFYHYNHGSTRFTGQGAIRVIYLAILLSHTILAAVVLPVVLTTVYRAVRGQFIKHARIAHWAYPIWLYVSITGVIVYLMLYHLYSK